MTIFINLGLPKTSSTNLQQNFYPNIKEVNYLGRHYPAKETGLFKKLDDYIENTNKNLFNDNYINDLKEEFTSFCKKSEKSILMSCETWMVPFQRIDASRKYKLVSQWTKLNKLSKFMKDLDIEIKYFLIYRNPIEAVPSFYASAYRVITNLFGRKYGDFNFVLKKILEEGHKTNEIKLFLDVYNLQKIKEMLSPKPLKVIDYKLINESPKEFLNEISDFFNVETNNSLVNNISIKIRVTQKDGNALLVGDRPNIYFYLKKIIPKFLIKILKKNQFLINFLKKFNIIKRIEIDKNLLAKVLKNMKIV